LTLLRTQLQIGSRLLGSQTLEATFSCLSDCLQKEIPSITSDSPPLFSSASSRTTHQPPTQPPSQFTAPLSMAFTASTATTHPLCCVVPSKDPRFPGLHIESTLALYHEIELGRVQTPPPTIRSPPGGLKPGSICRSDLRGNAGWRGGIVGCRPSPPAPWRGILEPFRRLAALASASDGRTSVPGILDVTRILPKQSECLATAGGSRGRL
jgi:hypothetical protein